MAQAEYVTNAIRALITGASAKPSTSPVRAAHAEFVAALAGDPPRPIPIDADVVDLEDRADHLNKVLSALSAYMAGSLTIPRRMSLGALIFATPRQSLPISHPT